MCTWEEPRTIALNESTTFAKPSKVTKGNGLTFTLEDGRQIIDASCGPSVSCLGHSKPEITSAITTHLHQDIAYAYSGSPYTKQAAEDLTILLLSSNHPGYQKQFSSTQAAKKQTQH
jgi:adenosylmethionine-8-amino-7-oxononanoate aminotransferase